MKLTCFVERSATKLWHGLCFDFDIAVDGVSVDDVMEKMQSAVKSYLEFVHELPENEHKAFLNRRVPLSVRLLCRARVALAHFFNTDCRSSIFIDQA